ncbi:unnamed protein product [Phytophthora lilii]|uniref:Unnamed protein product n=1 Tax=Phytophthora lilii TaxID=2077276 RepID=A0A9W6TU77_9STRA|nr:unnamed protein product [Phytophthora lilii]
MDEGGELFQDFSSDASDFDDDVDWSFTDGESASVLHLMGEARSIKKKGFGAADVVMPSSVALDASVAADAPKADGYVTSDVSKVCSDEELLDELFPETKSGPTPTVDKPTELQVGEEQCQTKECEVEWALMALEEHEQLGQQSRSSITASNDNEFVSLFEEMYGSDAAIELSTPSPLAGSKAGGRKWENTGTTTTTCPESANACISSDISGNITDKVAPLDMAQLVYQKIVEVSIIIATMSSLL